MWELRKTIRNNGSKIFTEEEYFINTFEDTQKKDIKEELSKHYGEKIKTLVENYQYFYGSWQRIKEYLNTDVLQLIRKHDITYEITNKIQEIENSHNIENIFNKTIIYITKAWDYHIICLYKEWKLVFWSFTSLWTNLNKSLENKIFSLSPKNTFISRRSKKYNNAIMPYSILVDGWFYIHWWLTDGRPRSHWCYRLPLYYAKWLFDIVKNNSEPSILLIGKLY
jgi:hypothetical protein